MVNNAGEGVKITLQKIIIVLFLLIPLASASEIESESFYIQSTHIGLSGYEGESTTYDARSTLTFQQGAEGEVGSSYTVDIGHFEPIDTIPPARVYLAPLASSVVTASPLINFQYNVTDNDEVAFCQLDVEGQISNDTYIENGQTNQFTVNLVDGVYNYDIECYDREGNNNTFEQIGFTVDFIQTGGGGGGRADPPEEEIDSQFEEFLETRAVRPEFEPDDLRLIAFIGLLWVAWYLFIFKEDKKRKVEYIK